MAPDTKASATLMKTYKLFMIRFLYSIYYVINLKSTTNRCYLTIYGKVFKVNLMASPYGFWNFMNQQDYRKENHALFLRRNSAAAGRYRR